MNEPSRYLQALARHVAAAYVAHAHPHAILLTGSAALGESDSYSDIDLIAYHDQPPDDQQRAAAREQDIGDLGASLLTRPYGDWFSIHGVECQVGHTTVTACEQHLAKVLDAHDPAADQNALSGLLQGMPLHGEALIRAWQALAAVYPDGLAQATVERHLRFLPVWWAPDYFAVRDASLLFHQSVVEACLNILGVLAGLNREYYSTFQLKRMRKFLGALCVAPTDVTDRIERILAGVPAAAAQDLETLVGETVALVEAHLPEVDTSAVRRDLGQRFQPWTPCPPPSG